MASHEYFQDLVPLYALDALSDAERIELKRHLAECAGCREQYGQELATVNMLPLALEPVEPSRETKAKLFARIDADLAQTAAPAHKSVRAIIPPPRRSWFARPAFAFAVVALLALLAIGGWIVLQNRPTPDQQAMQVILNSPKVQKVALQGTKDAPGAWGEVYMVPGDSRAVLKVGGLEPLPQDKGYQFWFFRGGDPQPSDVFIVDPDGTGSFLVKANDTVENFKGWGVTIEPRAGVPKPTGKIVILGGL